MGGFNSAFIRIPKDREPGAFADEVAERLFNSPGAKRTQWQVQYAQGFEWLHIYFFVVEGSPTETVIHPALGLLGGETIVLAAFGGVSFYLYRHFLNGQCLRAICVCEGKLDQNFGEEESWEKPTREAVFTKYGEGRGDWPRGFDTTHVINAFHLPSPWDSGPPELWDIDISWEDDPPESTTAGPERSGSPSPKFRHSGLFSGIVWTFAALIAFVCSLIIVSDQSWGALAAAVYLSPIANLLLATVALVFGAVLYRRCKSITLTRWLLTSIFAPLTSAAFVFFVLMISPPRGAC